MINVFDRTIQGALDFHADRLSKAFESDLFVYVGEIRPSWFSEFRQKLDEIGTNPDKSKSLVFMIHTHGGHAETVERMVRVVRKFYDEVFFVVPDFAMSAGTILCMSGDKIYMDYSSALGPIDPQVPSKSGNYVPALGYLDKYEEMVEKSRTGELSPAEFGIMQNQDLAELSLYEQAKELSISLLKDWLVKYKFKDWNKSNDAKVARAQEIADYLCDNKLWHSHGRMLGIEVLINVVKLKIDDFSDDSSLAMPIRTLSDLVLDCVKNSGSDHWISSNSFKVEEENDSE